MFFSLTSLAHGTSEQPPDLWEVGHSTPKAPMFSSLLQERPCCEQGLDSDRGVWRGGWSWTGLPRKVANEFVLFPMASKNCFISIQSLNTF